MANVPNAALLEQIKAMINRAITARMSTPQPVNPPLEQPKDDSRNGRWYAADLGFFDPNYKNKSVTTGEAMEHAGKDTIFRDIHLFIERAKDIAAVRGDKLVRQNLSTCLKGTALAWYTAELIADQKRLLKMGQDIDEWETKLVAQFKERPNVAMATIVRERYTLADAWSKQEPREYAGVIIGAAKSAELGSAGHIVMMIYNGLELEFQRNLQMPALTTPLEQFLQELDDHKDIWWGLAARFNNPYYASARNARNLYYNTTGYGRDQLRFNNYTNTTPAIRDSSYQFQPRINPLQYQQRETDSNQDGTRAIEPPKPKLMITAGPANGSDSRSSQTKQNEPSNRNPYRPYNIRSNPNQWNARGGGYQDRNWKQKGRAQSSYFSDSEAANHQQEEEISEETYHKEGMNGEQQEDQQTGAEDQTETYYQNEFGYHVGTTLLPSSKSYSCRRCSSIFPSNNKLHSHLRKCSHDQRLSYQAEVKAATLASKAFFADIPIIKSVAIANKPNSLAFRS